MLEVQIKILSEHSDQVGRLADVRTVRSYEPRCRPPAGRHRVWHLVNELKRTRGLEAKAVNIDMFASKYS